MFKTTRNDGSMGSIVICDRLTEPAENWKIQGGRYSSVLGIICLLAPPDPSSPCTSGPDWELWEQPRTFIEPQTRPQNSRGPPSYWKMFNCPTVDATIGWKYFWCSIVILENLCTIDNLVCIPKLPKAASMEAGGDEKRKVILKSRKSLMPNYFSMVLMFAASCGLHGGWGDVMPFWNLRIDNPVYINLGDWKILSEWWAGLTNLLLITREHYGVSMYLLLSQWQ